MKEKGLHASQLMGFRSLPATRLLARLEECNPDASNDRGSLRQPDFVLRRRGSRQRHDVSTEGRVADIVPLGQQAGAVGLGAAAPAARLLSSGEGYE